MKKNIIKEKSFAFAIHIVRMYQNITDKYKEFTVSRQCLRSGTAVGALMAESKYAQSKADFINKISIALKEANETIYWLELLKHTGYLTDDEHTSLYNEANEIVSILASIIKTMKNK